TIAILFLLGLSFSLYGQLINLEAFGEDFVVQTKQIYLPEYPDAFNPSIIFWKDRYIMSFRSRDPFTKKTNITHIIHLDENFDPVGPIYPLKFEQPSKAVGAVQDPRLIVVEEKLFTIYSDQWNTPSSSLRRVFLSEVSFDGVTYS